MKKILVHLGLPKTATTTLQHKLFQVLHGDGEINFLGKTLRYEEMSGRVEIINYKGKLIRDAVEERIPIADAKKALGTILVDNRLNVFSDEGIMVAYPGKDNLSIAKKILNLKAVLSDCEVEILVTLRNPLDYFNSLYVQLHPEFYSLFDKWDSSEKLSKFFTTNSNHVFFETFSYEKVLDTIGSSFDFHVLLFEDILYDKEAYYSGLGNVLPIDVAKIERLIGREHLNQKKKSSNGTKKIYSFKRIEQKARGIFESLPACFRVAKFFYVKTGLRKLVNYRFYLSGGVHVRQSGQDLVDLKTILLLANGFPFERFGLDREKCRRYGYLKNESENAV